MKFQFRNKLQFRDKIEVRWIDSYGGNLTGWGWKRDIESSLNFHKSFMYIKSVGQFVTEDKEIIVMCHTINEKSETILSPIYIPKVAILEIKKL